MSGDPIHPGDIVETEDGESVNLLFSDESSILVGENARLEIDDYVMIRNLARIVRRSACFAVSFYSPVG
jgi:hypothetical protein